MAKRPDDLVNPILPDIQKVLGEHTNTLADHTKRFERLERQLDDVSEGMVTALGLASHAQVRHEAVDKRFDRIEERLQKLEEKV